MQKFFNKKIFYADKTKIICLLSVLRASDSFEFLTSKMMY